MSERYLEETLRGFWRNTNKNIHNVRNRMNRNRYTIFTVYWAVVVVVAIAFLTAGIVTGSGAAAIGGPIFSASLGVFGAIMLGIMMEDF